MTEQLKQRSIQEYVPGKQATLAHMIAHPDPELCRQIGVSESGAIGLMTITPGEGAIIAADVAGKCGDIRLEFVDRFTGCLVFTGDVAAVDVVLLIRNPEVYERIRLEEEVLGTVEEEVGDA